MMPPLPTLIGYLKDTSIVSLQRDESTVLLYPHDYLIRPSVAVVTVDQMLAYGLAVAEACAKLCEELAAKDSRDYDSLICAAAIREMANAAKQ